MTRVRRWQRLGACVLIASGIAVLASWWISTGQLARFRGPANDVLFPRDEPADGFAVVAIDRRSLTGIDTPWPWPRDLVAELVNALAELGPTLIVLDLLLTDTRPGDEVLAEALTAAGDVVLVAAPVEVIDRGPGKPFRAATLVEPPATLASAAPHVGVSVLLPDRPDGTVRRQALVVEDVSGRILSAPALAATQLTVGDAAPPLLRSPGDLQIAGTRIPTDDRYRLVISWPAGLDDTEADRWVSAIDVLAGVIDRSRVEDRVVFVGVVDPSLGDRPATPVSEAAGTPGVLHHAAAFHTLASQRFLTPASVLEAVAWVGLAALLVGLATQFLPVLIASATNLALIAGTTFGVLARGDSGVVVDVIDPVIGTLLAIPASIGVREVLERRHGRRVARLFSEYVPAPVAQALVERGMSEKAVSGQRLRVTVLFCDLRGFTPLAARLAPAQIQRLLTEYYSYVSGVVLAHEGTVVQYVGDEVFAAFGAPLPGDDHAERALRAAIALQSSRGQLDAQVHPDIGALHFGIGVHTGEVIAALAGNETHRQYALIGDAVNVGSRLCGQAGAGEVVVSEASLQLSGLQVNGEPSTPELTGLARPPHARRIKPVVGLGPGRA